MYYVVGNTRESAVTYALETGKYAYADKCVATIYADVFKQNVYEVTPEEVGK